MACNGPYIQVSTLSVKNLKGAAVSYLARSGKQSKIAGITNHQWHYGEFPRLQALAFNGHFLSGVFK